MKFHLTPVSRNRKTGPIPVTMASPDTCPPTCPWRDIACYARTGPLSITWRRHCNLSPRQFVNRLHALPAHSLVRLNQAGDLPGDGVHLDYQLIQAMDALPLRIYTYTHYDPTHIADFLRQLRMTVNLSANTPAQARSYASLYGLPVVTVLPSSPPYPTDVLVCPAVTKNVTCKDCRLCAIRNRRQIIGFPAHGAKKTYIDRYLEVHYV